MILLGLLTALALSLFVVGFFKPDLVVWLIDTVLWLIWAYMAYNQAVAENVGGANTYIPTALALVGAGFVLACIYKDFAIIISMVKKSTKRMDASAQYDDEKRRNQQHIYNITKRPNRW